MDNTLDFAAGVRFIMEHDPGVVTKNILTRFQVIVATGAEPGAYEIGKLEYALSKIAEAPSLSPPRSPRRGEERGKSGIPTDKTKASDAPPPIGGAGGGTSPRAKELHKAHAHHHALMVTADDDAARAEHAGKIIEQIVPALDAEYDRLRGSDSAGDSKSPAELKSDPTEADKLRRLQSVRTRIGQLKKKIANPKDLKQKQKYETELAEKEAERDRLQAELG